LNLKKFNWYFNTLE